MLDTIHSGKVKINFLEGARTTPKPPLIDLLHDQVAKLNKHPQFHNYLNLQV
jgi:hypothetical protein